MNGESHGGGDEGDEAHQAEHRGGAEEDDGEDGGGEVGLGLLDEGDDGLHVGLGSAGVGSNLRQGQVGGLVFEWDGKGNGTSPRLLCRMLTFSSKVESSDASAEGPDAPSRFWRDGLIRYQGATFKSLSLPSCLNGSHAAGENC